jgi:hypothetical protein
MDKAYVDTVRLLLETTPILFRSSPLFSMKGGTAINLFVQDMPRLSVDIDVVYRDYSASRAIRCQTFREPFSSPGSSLRKRE